MRILLLAAMMPACLCAVGQARTTALTATQTPRQLDSLPTVLACAQAALGGAAALGRVSSLLVSVEMRSADSTQTTGTRQLAIEWPDKFMDRSSQHTLPAMAWGITGQTLISAAMVRGKWEVHTTKGSSLTNSHKNFAHLALMWLLRTSALVPLKLSYVGREPALVGQVVIAAAGPESFNARLSVDERTCLLSSLTFSRPPDASDRMRSKGQPLPATIIEGFELADYSPAGPIQFPMVMTRVLSGRPTGIWRVTDVAVNPALKEFFELK